MLKRILATISTIIYFTVSTGVVVNMHYCMDKFDSVQLYATSSEICNKCGMHTSDSNGCCHDELKVVKLNEDHTFSQVILELKSPESQPAVYSEIFSSLNKQRVRLNDFQNHSPPLLSKQDNYLQNCVFRI